MPASMATVASILKEIYEPGINKQLNDSVTALRRIERSSDGVTSVGGKYVTFAIKTRRNQGIGARNELEALPVPGQQGNAAARVSLKYQYGGIQLSGQTFDLASKDFQAFTSVLEQETTGLKDDLAKDLNRQVYGDGSGVIAVAGSAGTGNTFNAANAMYVQQDMMVDIIDGTTLANPTPTVKASNRQITGIVTNTLTFSGATQASSTGDILVRTGSVNREWTGFAKIISATGTLYNVDPLVETVWKATVNANGGTLRALSEGLMNTTADAIRAQGGKVTAIFTNLGVRRAYSNLLIQQRQFVNTTKFTGGFSGLAYTTDSGDIPVVIDTDAPPNKMYFVNENEITLYRENDWKWMDRDGSMWQRVINSSGVFDAYEARLYQYSELGVHRRNTFALLSDITEG